MPNNPTLNATLAVLTHRRTGLDIAVAKVLAPELGSAIAGIKGHPGLPRASMTVPISPQGNVSDDLVFESPTNPAERFYLPRYRVATRSTDRGEQFQLLLKREQDPGTRLTVVVEPFQPTEVAAVAPDARPLVHELAALLVFDIPGGAGMRREWLFADRRTLDAGALELSLTVATLADRGELFAALTMPEAHARLVVRRSLTVAIHTSGQPGFLIAGERLAATTRREGVLIAREPLVATTPREGVLTARVEGITTTPTARVVRIDDLARRVGRRERLEPATEPQDVLYRATTRILDQTLTPSPFVFSPDLHGYIFGDIRGGSGQGGMVLEQIPHGDRHHSYYVQADRPEVAYYLPDAFKLSRTPERPRTPLMSVVFDSPAGAAEDTTAIVVFAASPWISPGRLEAAEAALRARIAGAGGSAPATIDLQPLIADESRLSLRVSLPGSAGSATELPDALIDLRAGLRAGFSLPLAQFQAMFDRLHGSDPELLHGVVDVVLDRPDRPSEQVPLVIRMDDLAGDVVDVACVPQPDGGGFACTFANAIESPLRLVALTARLPQPGGALACRVEGLPPGTEIAAGASTSGVIVPDSPPTDPGALPVVDREGMTVLPDGPAIWDAICEDTTSHLSREITVKTPSVMFAPPSDGSTAIIELVVDVVGLTGGLPQTVSLNADALQQTTTMAVPIADLVLRTEDTGEYRYRVTAVRPDRVVEGEWKTRSSAVLWIVTQDVG